MKCDICGKSAIFGSNVSHSKRHTARQWLPNIHPATLNKDGVPVHMNVCTRCLRNQKKLAGKA
jgi:large subunit ribosomal protein L28